MRSGFGRRVLRNATLLASLALLFSATDPAAEIESPADRFDGIRAWRADSTLCLPEFEGRRPGTKGGRAAEEWIASRFAAAGLTPASAEGTYFQEFEVIGYHEKRASLELLDSPFGKIRFVHGDDFILLHTPSAGRVSAEAVIVGFGIDAPEKGRNDYEGIDLEGKIAVILRGRPDDEQNWDKEYSRNHTYPAAIAHGAVAVLYQQRTRPIAGAALSPEAHDPHVPACYVGERIADLLLRETGWMLETVRDSLKKGPLPIETGKRLRFHTKIGGEPRKTTRNVLGFFPGVDPKLQHEIVMFGAHHDHIGIDAGGRLYAGANDNGSGSSVVIELARALRSSGWVPRRTILFATFGAEEMGLLGSKHLAAHLPFDSTRLVAMVNLDMAGHGDGGFSVAGGVRFGPVYFDWREGLDSLRAEGLTEYQLRGGGNSDYAPFADRGIPAAGCWSHGDHTRYHDFEDLPRFVRPDVLGSVGRGLGSLLVALADWPEPMADGLGWERILRSNAIQVVMTPEDSDRLLAPDRMAFSGEGRLAGRFVAVDEGNAKLEVILSRLGRLIDLAADRPWCERARAIDDLTGAWNKLHVAIVPVVRTELLDALGREIVTSLSAAGIVGAFWPAGMATPSHETTAALSRDDRLLLISSSNDWRSIAAREEVPKIIIHAGPNDPIPDRPDEESDAELLFALTVSGLEDSTRVRRAHGQWGDEHLHIDISGGLESGVDDAETLRFIRWLRDAGWKHETITANLGENLVGF